MKEGKNKIKRHKESMDKLDRQFKDMMSSIDKSFDKQMKNGLFSELDF